MPAKIKQGKYVDSDGVENDVVFIGAEKAIFDDNGTRLDNKLVNMSKASGLTAEDAEGILGTADANVNFQALVDAIADKVMNELVTNSALTTQLANYVTKAMMSNVQVNDNNHVPTSGLVYGMNEDINQLSSEFINYYALVDRTIIPVSSDLDNYKTPGSYLVVDATGLKNKPWSGNQGAQITVSQYSGVSFVRMVANVFNDNDYYRDYDSTYGWGEWKSLVTNADIQYGTVTVNAAQNETTEFSVTFPRQFSSTPQVVVTVATSGPKDNIASVLSITTNGFMGYLYRGGVTANMSIRWIAIGY